ncbi:hypothetical protein SAMN06297144_2420 [Sphingomonas guangdongensis]|uniref:Uncharacterized protein n=1 Tax=Sphingomonas guangdongensis TaxID=1141890 RepID=A0A285R4L5_9SPHN|nr:hypothetical protein [Sphingomonas guangdongensis]SOB87292.1 hypothetical protein SAMN06297144_2420 [Sphingomonas guangdongensis]
MKIIPSLLSAAALVALPVVAVARDTPDQELAKLLAGRVAGEPVNCIDPTWNATSTIIDGKAIVYRVGSKLYVNTPRAGAESLRDDDILLTRIWGTRLCSIDNVQLIDRNARFPRGFVILDKFVPYTKPKTQ